MSEIYIVSAGVRYEGTWPIKAFEKEAEAEEFALKCNEYTKANVERCKEESSYEYVRNREARNKNHPAGGENSMADSFSVTAIPFIK